MSDEPLVDLEKTLPGIRERVTPIAKQFFDLYCTDRNFRFDRPLVAVDVETEGLDHMKHSVIEIGAVSFRYDGVDVSVGAFWAMLNHGRALPKVITEITGITDTDIQLHGQPPERVYQDFLNWLEDIRPAYLVAHNSQFDERMLVEDLKRYDFPSCLGEFLCTKKLSIRHLPKLENNKLVKVAEHLNIVNPQAHRALSDAETCARAFFNIMVLAHGKEI